MNEREDEPAKRRCSCGADLLWEKRYRRDGQPSLALCSSEKCGLYTTGSDDIDPSEALQAFLLGNQAPVRYMAPWSRLFFKTVRWGFGWIPTVLPCPACSSDLRAELFLRPREGAQGDPYLVQTCLTCGATTISFWMSGESVALSMDGAAWEESPTALQALKRCLHERVLESDHRPWR